MATGNPAVERVDASAENSDPVLCSSSVSKDWMNY